MDNEQISSPNIERINVEDISIEQDLMALDGKINTLKKDPFTLKKRKKYLKQNLPELEKYMGVSVVFEDEEK